MIPDRLEFYGLKKWFLKRGVRASSLSQVPDPSRAPRIQKLQSGARASRFTKPPGGPSDAHPNVRTTVHIL